MGHKIPVNSFKAKKRRASLEAHFEGATADAADTAAQTWLAVHVPHRWKWEFALSTDDDLHTPVAGKKPSPTNYITGVTIIPPNTATEDDIAKVREAISKLPRISV
jgi:hypothetical protein